jgi:hypothetical protein
MVKHAGSDLDRLCRVPDLGTAYSEVLRSARCVVTQPYLMPRFLAMGVREEALCPDIAYPVPVQFFNSAVQPLDINRLQLRSLRDPETGHIVPVRDFDPKIPAIGVYGKIGIAKGTFDLIAALGRLAREGVAFNFAAMIGEVQAAKLVSTLKSNGILERSHLLPFLPCWKVPSFIRACTAVCFLERDFPIAIHGPIVPREILACGTCLLLSGEIAEKQISRGEFSSGDNLVVVDDPKDHDDLAGKLRFIISDSLRAQEIGRKGNLIPGMRGEHAEFRDGWEQLFIRLLSNNPANSPQGAEREPKPASPVHLRRFAPKLRSVLETMHPEIIDEFHTPPAEKDPAEAGIEFCAFVQARLGLNGSGRGATALRDAIRYQESRLQTANHPAGGDPPVFAVVDQLNGRSVSEEFARNLRPVHSGTLDIRAFDFDVTPLFNLDEDPDQDLQAELERLPEERMYVLFQRTANAAPKELRVNHATKSLIERCDGSCTTDELLSEVGAQFGGDAQLSRQSILAALDKLYTANIVVFGEKKPGWGWTGGFRFDTKEPEL